jgi:murein DD-endopeptidase MepM/ murein hydrolase activator NlpD
MKLIKPFSIIGQGFGANAVPLYNGQGLRGHTGIDFGADWGAPIRCAVDSYCYSVMNRDNPNLMAYRAVYTLVDDGDVTYEVSYGHCSAISAVPGKTYKVGDILANVGNTGDVFSGPLEVTKAEKDAGSHAGQHLHFQVRKLKKVPISLATDPTTQYIMDGNGIYSKDGNYYSVPEYSNGYNGCVDPTPFFVVPVLSPSDKLVTLANEMMATNPSQARIILAVAAFIRAFS